MKIALRAITLAMALIPLACSVVPDTVSSAAAESAKDRNPEIWVTLQATDRIAMLHGPTGHGDREMIQLPAGTGPHITTFSPDRKFAYVSGMGNGDLDVISTATRHVVSTVSLGKVATHQAKPSPDGKSLLVAQVGSKSLIKVSADEANHSWEAGQVLSFAALNKAPICSIFSNDGARAFVSLNPSGLAIVDVPTMGIRSVVSTDGFIACGMVQSAGGASITLASSGGGGHIYRLDIGTEQLSDLGTLGAVDWHSFNMVPDGKIGFGTAPRGDELRIIDLRGDHASTLAALSLNPSGGPARDQPDNMGVSGDYVYASLRMSGKLAVVNFRKQSVSYIDLASPAVAINPANCLGCALHGVAVLR
jgi:DNA-binding beta-propeller fold protein YncE